MLYTVAVDTTANEVTVAGEDSSIYRNSIGTGTWTFKGFAAAILGESWDAGLAKRLEHIGKPKIALGVSGGLDSATVLALARADARWR